MSVIEFESAEAELEYDSRLEHHHGLVAVDMPCECTHSPGGEHLSPGEQDCLKPATWRTKLKALLDLPAETYYLCDNCKNALAELELLENAERIK